MSPQLRSVRAYGLAIALSAFALALAGLTASAFGGAYFHFPLIAVFVVALYCGLGPGLLAVILCGFGFDLLYLGPPLRLGVGNIEEAHRLTAFVLSGAAATWIAARFRSAKHDADQARRAAEAASEEARRIGELQERLVAIVGHDLRNPLSAVKGLADILPRLGPLTPKQADAVARMSRSAGRMEALIRDVLDLARSRQGRLIELKPSDVRVGEICARVVAEIRDGDPRADIAFEMEGDDGAHLDGARVAQVASNLVTNALRHARPGTAVRLRVLGRDHEIALQVENDGEPISAELAARVFEPFQRGTDDGRGLGLGLFIVREIARAHGGTVGFRREGSRTVFDVRLPRAVPMPEGRAGARPPPSPRPAVTPTS